MPFRDHKTKDLGGGALPPPQTLTHLEKLGPGSHDQLHV